MEIQMTQRRPLRTSAQVRIVELKKGTSPWITCTATAASDTSSTRLSAPRVREDEVSGEILYTRQRQIPPGLAMLYVNVEQPASDTVLFRMWASVAFVGTSEANDGMEVLSLGLETYENGDSISLVLDGMVPGTYPMPTIGDVMTIVLSRDSAIGETDPNGLSAHTPGAKLDAGKPLPDLVLGDFANALAAVVGVGTFGARKYTPHGWLEVSDGAERYADAAGRHWLWRKRDTLYDSDSGMLHEAHEVWNRLASLELKLRAGLEPTLRHPDPMADNPVGNHADQPSTEMT